MVALTFRKKEKFFYFFCQFFKDFFTPLICACFFNETFYHYKMESEELKMKLTVLKTSVLIAVLSGATFTSTEVQAATKNATEVKVNTQEENPNVFIENIGKSLFSELKNKSAAVKKNPDLLKTIVKEKLLPYVNTKYAGSVIMGNYFKDYTDQERQSFFTALEGYLVQQYAQIFTLYDGQEIKYLQNPTSDKSMHRAAVQVLQKNGASPVNVSFAMRKNSKTKEWQIYDVVAEGVSLVQSKRAEWTKTFREKKLSELNTQLEKISQEPISFSK